MAIGDQTALENASNAAGVFQFIRIEDIAYDRNHPNVVYMADSGAPRPRGPTTGRLRRAGTRTNGPDPERRMFRFDSTTTPKKVHSLSILIDGDTRGFAPRA